MARSQCAQVNARRLRKAKGILLAAAMRHKSRDNNPLKFTPMGHRVYLKSVISAAHPGKHLVSKIISVNVGLPRDVVWHGRDVSTGIFKEPVEGRLILRKLD